MPEPVSSQSWSPYANPILRWPGVLLLIAIVWNPMGYGDDRVMAIVAGSAKILLAVVAVGAVLHWRFRGPFGRMKQLQRDLPWFGLRPVTSHPLADEPDLLAKLARHDYTVSELDGRAIRSWHDLAVALEATFGAMRFPSDPRAKCSALLMRGAYQKPRRRVLVWRDAAASLAADPSLVIDFASTWAAMAHEVRPGMLLFLDLPAGPVARSQPAVDERLHVVGEHGGEADRGLLAGAPHGAWWKPQPGELSR